VPLASAIASSSSLKVITGATGPKISSLKAGIEEPTEEVWSPTITTGSPVTIPEDYVPDLQLRLNLYRRLSMFETDAEIETFAAEMIDRFGPMPPQVDDLFDTVRIRKLAVSLGFEKLILKQDDLRCYFINRPDSPYFESETFRLILEYLQKHTNKAKLKQTGKHFLLVVDDIRSMAALLGFLKRMANFVSADGVPA